MSLVKVTLRLLVTHPQGLRLSLLLPSPLPSFLNLLERKSNAVTTADASESETPRLDS